MKHLADTSKNKELRDARLDALKEAFDEYIDKEIERQENVVDLLEKILEGHNTPTSSSKTVIDDISILAEREFSKFLTG